MKLDFAGYPNVTVLVVGDVMLDRYWSGPSTRISAEAPVPIIHVTAMEERPGGAANVALNVAALGARAELLGLVGDDEAGRAITKQLSDCDVMTRLRVVPDIPTCTKYRVLSQHQQLLRIDRESDLGRGDLAGLLEDFYLAIQTASVLVLSDYAKGTLADPGPYIRAANQHGLPVLVDPKGRDFQRYRGATLMTPNRAEFEAIAGRCVTEAELLSRGEALRQDLGLAALLLTRGEHGMTLLADGREPHYLPTRAREVFDVTGAGDTVIATLAVALATGHTLADAAHLANVAAGIVVGKLGAAVSSIAELNLELNGSSTLAGGVLSEEQALGLMRQIRAKGGRIVMTHGHFDPLRASHIAFLKEARTQGEGLFVAVPTHAQLPWGSTEEGKLMPDLAEHMTVLAALRAVDGVIPLTEPEPDFLYQRLMPDMVVLPDETTPAPITSSSGGGFLLPYRLRPDGMTVKGI
jgi:D-beta-D-heptose 7-phosphate kinase/D-beta-D-heptose 1-phosphate adenosyltransferase